MLYTDGVTEAVNPNNDFYGEKRFIETLQTGLNTKKTSEETVKLIKSSVYEFYDGREQFDDLTVLALVYK